LCLPDHYFRGSHIQLNFRTFPQYAAAVILVRQSRIGGLSIVSVRATVLLLAPLRGSSRLILSVARRHVCRALSSSWGSAAQCEWSPSKEHRSPIPVCGQIAVSDRALPDYRGSAARYSWPPASEHLNPSAIVCGQTPCVPCPLRLSRECCATRKVTSNRTSEYRTPLQKQARPTLSVRPPPKGARHTHGLGVFASRRGR
jgi:hypothetical protein